MLAEARLHGVGATDGVGAKLRLAGAALGEGAGFTESLGSEPCADAMAAARRHVELAEVAITNCKRCNAPLNPTGAPRYCADCLQSL